MNAQARGLEGYEDPLAARRASRQAAVKRVMGGDEEPPTGQATEEPENSEPDEESHVRSQTEKRSAPPRKRAAKKAAASRSKQQNAPPPTNQGVPMPPSKNISGRRPLNTRLSPDLHGRLQTFLQRHQATKQDTADMAVREFLVRRDMAVPGNDAPIPNLPAPNERQAGNGIPMPPKRRVSRATEQFYVRLQGDIAACLDKFVGEYDTTVQDAVSMAVSEFLIARGYPEAS